MRLRTQLAALLALFAVVPLAAALVPVIRALSRALASEHAARLDGAARALNGELARLSQEASSRVGDLARSPEAEAFSRDLAASTLSPADAAARGADWMEARGLDVLTLATPGGQVVTSGHLPGRAGDVDPQLGPVFQAPPGTAVPLVVTRAGPSGPEPGAGPDRLGAVPGEGRSGSRAASTSTRTAPCAWPD